MLAYECLWNRSWLVVATRRFPSHKTCSCGGLVLGDAFRRRRRGHGATRRVHIAGRRWSRWTCARETAEDHTFPPAASWRLVVRRAWVSIRWAIMWTDKPRDILFWGICVRVADSRHRRLIVSRADREDGRRKSTRKSGDQIRSGLARIRRYGSRNVVDEKSVGRFGLCAAKHGRQLRTREADRLQSTSAFQDAAVASGNP